MASEPSETIYLIMYQGQALGSSRLEFRDSSMGVAFGRFDPLPAYELVRDIFLLFTDAQGETRERDKPDEAKLADYYRARDALNLTLVTADGRFVSTRHIHIVDWGELGREVEVQIQDAMFWQMLQSE